MQVQVSDICAQIKPNSGGFISALAAVVNSGRFVLGPFVERFEESFAEYVGVKHAIGVASGSDALLLALMAVGVRQHDFVITTPYTFFATAGVIWRLGAVPVFVDIDPVTFNIDPAGLRPAINKIHDAGGHVQAIVPVHLFGHCADMGAINNIAEEYRIPVVEDACQAIGATYDGVKAGVLGTLGCFSFYPTKNLGGFGDGGMITTNDDSLAMSCRRLRVHGSGPKYWHTAVGVNSRLDALQAAVLAIMLKDLDEWNELRVKHAQGYWLGLCDLSGVQVPVEMLYCKHVYNQYVVRVEARDKVRDLLLAAGIGTEVYYPTPLHLQPCFAELCYEEGSLPVAEQASAETLALPMYPFMTVGQRQYVVREFIKAMEVVG